MDDEDLDLEIRKLCIEKSKREFAESAKKLISDGLVSKEEYYEILNYTKQEIRKMEV